MGILLGMRNEYYYAVQGSGEEFYSERKGEGTATKQKHPFGAEGVRKMVEKPITNPTFKGRIPIVNPYAGGGVSGQEGQESGVEKQNSSGDVEAAGAAGAQQQKIISAILGQLVNDFSNTLGQTPLDYYVAR